MPKEPSTVESPALTSTKLQMLNMQVTANVVIHTAREIEIQQQYAQRQLTNYIQGIDY